MYILYVLCVFISHLLLTESSQRPRVLFPKTIIYLSILISSHWVTTTTHWINHGQQRSPRQICYLVASYLVTFFFVKFGCMLVFALPGLLQSLSLFIYVNMQTVTVHADLQMLSCRWGHVLYSWLGVCVCVWRVMGLSLVVSRVICPVGPEAPSPRGAEILWPRTFITLDKNIF